MRDVKKKKKIKPDDKEIEKNLNTTLFTIFCYVLVNIVTLFKMLTMLLYTHERARVNRQMMSAL